MDSFESLQLALKNYFSDTTRTPAETKNGLDLIRDEIDILIDSLE